MSDVMTLTSASERETWWRAKKYVEKVGDHFFDDNF